MQQIIAVQVNSHSLNFVRLLERGRKRRLIQSGHIKIDEGEKAPSMALIRKAQLFFKDMPLLNTDIISVVTSPYIVIQEFIFPQLSSKELHESVKWKIKDFLNFPVEEAILSTRIVEKIGEGHLGKLKILVVAIPRADVARHVEILKTSGLMPSTVTIIPIVLENAIRDLQEVKDDIAVLHIGSELSILNIYKKRKLIFSRIIASKLERFASEIQLSMDYFFEESQGGKVKRIIITGEKWQKEAAETIEKNLGLSIVSIDLLKAANIIYDKNSLLHNGSQVAVEKITVPLCAALGSDKYINLLPEEEKKEKKTYLVFAGVRILSIFVSFIFVFIYLSIQFQIYGYKERLTAAKAELENLNPLIYQIEPLENLDKDVSNRVTLIEKLLARRYIGSGILKQIGRAMPPNMILSEITVDERQMVIKGTITSLGKPPENILSLFIASLEVGILKNVSLVSAQKDEFTGILEFNLTAELEL